MSLYDEGWKLGVSRNRFTVDGWIAIFLGHRPAPSSQSNRVARDLGKIRPSRFGLRLRPGDQETSQGRRQVVGGPPLIPDHRGVPPRSELPDRGDGPIE